MISRFYQTLRHAFRNLSGPSGSPDNQAGQTRDRIIVIICGVVVVFAIVQARLIAIGFSEMNGPARLAQQDLALAASRPKIVDREGRTMALDIEVQSLFSEPKHIEKPEEIFAALSTVLPGLDEKRTLKKLKSGRGFEWLKREITPRQQADILALGLPGIGFRPETKRFYPSGATTSHIVGDTDMDNKGIAGLESHLDRTGLRDLHAAGFALREELPTVRMSVDLRVQHFVREALAGAMERYKAVAAGGVVLDAQTGEIVAMSSLPDYNPNLPSKSDDPGLYNRMTAGIFEMGSTFKMFTTAMALDSGRVNLNSRFDARKPIRIGR
ncbi:MAG: penicillin-binding transpeptidase domain-containing protein, partial [Pseudomonadota bacterium]